MVRITGSLLGVAVALFVLQVIAGAQLTRRETKRVFTDGQFLDSDWSVASVFGLGAGGVTSASQQPSGGNGGGQYRRVVIDVYDAMPGMRSSHWAVHLRAAASWNPKTQGPIRSIDYSEFARMEVTTTCAGCQNTGIALRQAGSYYVVRFGGIGTSVTWQPFSLPSLRETDFSMLQSDGSIDPAQHPDFRSGGLLEFGFIRGNSTGVGGGGFQRRAAIDDWKAELTVELWTTLSPHPFVGAPLVPGLPPWVFFHPPGPDHDGHLGLER